MTMLSSTPPPEAGLVLNTVHALVTLFEAWHQQEPDDGPEAPAAEWRAKAEK